MNSFDFSTILGYNFENPNLLRQALTSKAYDASTSNNTWGYRDSLAAIGDPILSLIVVEFATQVRGFSEKGDISKFKDYYISGKNIASTMRSIMNEDFLSEGELFQYTSKGEQIEEQIKGDRFLGETLEAIVGAIYLDGGFEKAKKIAWMIFFLGEY